MSDEPTNGVRISKALLLKIAGAVVTVLLSNVGIVKILEGDKPATLTGTTNIAAQNLYDLKIALLDIENLKLRVKQLEAK